MVIHKYIFFINDKGITTYRVRNNSVYEIVRYKGEKLCKDKDIKKFFQWFEKTASIACDDEIDFCFLSEQPIESLSISYPTPKLSSWKQDDILGFCQSIIGIKNYEILVDEKHKFVCQISNLINNDDTEKLYLKCIPEICFEQKKLEQENFVETSILCRYFIERLNDL